MMDDFELLDAESEESLDAASEELLDSTETVVSIQLQEINDTLNNIYLSINTLLILVGAIFTYRYILAIWRKK